MANALASSRRWRRATLRDETRSSRWPRKWTSSSSERIAFLTSGSRCRRWSRPTATRMFSATVISGSSAGCWWTIAIPRSCAVAGVRFSTGEPSKMIVPASGAVVPEATFIRVDLPAPFSPSRACTSPGRTSNETSVSAAIAL